MTAAAKRLRRLTSVYLRTGERRQTVAGTSGLSERGDAKKARCRETS
jgi:hypothetical protein